MNNFLRTGQKCSNSPMDGSKEHESSDNGIETDTVQCTSMESGALTECKMISSNQPQNQIEIDDVLDIIEKSGTAISEPREIAQFPSNVELAKNVEINKVSGPDPTKPLRQKAKILRHQRKMEKQLTKLSSSDAMLIDPKVDAMPWKKTDKNTVQTLQKLIDAMPTNGQHKLQVNSLNEYKSFS